VREVRELCTLASIKASEVTYAVEGADDVRAREPTISARSGVREDPLTRWPEANR
jgi:hypothetical protein